MPRKTTKGITTEDVKSQDSGAAMHTPTYLYDAACLEGGCEYADYRPYDPNTYAHQRRLRRHTVEQGHCTYTRESGDFKNF